MIGASRLRCHDELRRQQNPASRSAIHRRKPKAVPARIRPRAEASGPQSRYRRAALDAVPGRDRLLAGSCEKPDPPSKTSLICALNVASRHTSFPLRRLISRSEQSDNDETKRCDHRETVDGFRLHASHARLAPRADREILDLIHKDYRLYFVRLGKGVREFLCSKPRLRKM